MPRAFPQATFPPKYSVNGHKRPPGSNEQYGIQEYGIHKYSINRHKRTPGSNEQYKKNKYSINGHKRTPGSNEQYKKTNIQ